jgi:hypothetical protein
MDVHLHGKEERNVITPLKQLAAEPSELLGG